jgi:hypothetical protein
VKSRKPKKRDNNTASLVEFFQSAPDGHALDLERKSDATRTIAELERLWRRTSGNSGGKR